MRDAYYPDNILVVADQTSAFEQLVQALREDYTVFFACTRAEAELRLQGELTVVLADQRVLEIWGGGLIEKAYEMHPETGWILFAGGFNAQRFAPAIERGQIFHCLKPHQEAEEVILLVKRAVEYAHLTAAHKKLLADFQAIQEQNQALQEKEHHPECHAIHADKMVTLGQMVAGITHEMNTPAGAISAAIVNMTHQLKAFIESLWELERQQITREDFKRILGIVANIAAALDGNQRRSSGEVRGEQQRITELLDQQSIHNSRKLAKHIARMDLTEQIEALLVLVKRYDLDSILMFFTHWSRIVNSVKDIRISIDLLTRIVQALKSYSYPRQEKPELADIHESIDTALTILTNKLKHRIRVERRYGDLPKIWCYASELSHVWLNLIQNAIQAINGEGEISIETFHTATDLGVRITDNGLGIPADIQDRIFDLDFTTKPQGEGTGFGLYFVHQIVEKHGGTIGVVSRPRNTTFEVHFPLSLPQVIESS